MRFEDLLELDSFINLAIIQRFIDYKENIEAERQIAEQREKNAQMQYILEQEQDGKIVKKKTNKKNKIAQS